jgi:hypothetical protein
MFFICTELTKNELKMDLESFLENNDLAFQMRKPLNLKLTEEELEIFTYAYEKLITKIPKRFRKFFVNLYFSRFVEFLLNHKT